MSEIKIYCKGCKKPLKTNTILKHLSHKSECKKKYSHIQIKDLENESKKAFNLKRKAWKRADYRRHKSKYSMENADQYKKRSIKYCGKIIQNQYDSFLKRLAKINHDELIKAQLQDVEEMMKAKYVNIMKEVDFALEKCDIKHLELHDKEWSKLCKQAWTLVNIFTPKVDTPNPQPISSISASEKIECKSCHKKFQETSILKHITKSLKCCEDYSNTKELGMLQKKSSNREIQRLQKRYQDEKESRKAEHRSKRNDFLLQKKIEEFEMLYEGLLNVNVLGSLKPIIRILNEWDSDESRRGRRIRKEISKFKAKGITEITQSMVQTESMITDKQNNLAVEIEEALEEVEESIGHFEFDEYSDKWRKEMDQDRDFANNMLLNCRYYVEQEMEDLYVTVVQILKDTGIKLNDEIEPDNHSLWDTDDHLKKPFWLGQRGKCWTHIPRNVILK